MATSSDNLVGREAKFQVVEQTISDETIYLWQEKE
jgi:hypothetical protein